MGYRPRMTAEAMLAIWGLRASGTSLKSPLKASTGGKAGDDDELAVVTYVQQTAGFDLARPVLRRVYCDGCPAEGDWWRGPGETLVRAALRLGWGSQLGHVAPRQIPVAIRDEFIRTLNLRLGATPYRLPERSEKLCGIEKAEHVAALLKAVNDLPLRPF